MLMTKLEVNQRRNEIYENAAGMHCGRDWRKPRYPLVEVRIVYLLQPCIGTVSANVRPSSVVGI